MKTFCFAKVGSPYDSSYQEFFRSLKVGEFAHIVLHNGESRIIRKDYQHAEISKILRLGEVYYRFKHAWNSLPSSYRGDSCLTFFTFEGDKTLYATYDIENHRLFDEHTWEFKLVPCPETWKRKNHRKWVLIV